MKVDTQLKTVKLAQAEEEHKKYLRTIVLPKKKD